MLNLKSKWLKITIISITILFIAPTIAFGGSFVISLIQGKTADEAVQIIAEQIDGLLGRVENIESKINILEIEKQRDEVCRKMKDLEFSTNNIISNYKLTQKITIFDACNGLFGGYKCVSASKISNEQELVDNLRQNYPHITIMEIKEELNKLKTNTEKSYLEDAPNRIKYNQLKVYCEKLNNSLNLAN